MSVPRFGPLPSVDATWPAGRPVDPCPLTSLRRVPESVGAVSEGWTPFLALSKSNRRDDLCLLLLLKQL